MQRILALLLVTAGLAVGGWALLDDTGADIGTLSIEEPATTAGGATDADATASSDAPSNPPDASPDPAVADPSPRPSPPAIARSSGRIADIDATALVEPSRLAVPSIGIEAAVVPVGVDPDGLMTVPDDVSTVGWYRWGAAPSSEAGVTVLAGHVDDRVQGRGAFFDLRAVEVGDEVAVTDQDGATTTWRVTGRRTYDKASLPIDELYRRDGAPRLVLITCGGEFDRAARSYESNVVVEAEPLS